MEGVDTGVAGFDGFVDVGTLEIASELVIAQIEWNDLLDQLYAESDIEAALPISKQLTEIFAEHVPAACLVSKNFLFIGDASLTGFYTATKCDMLNFDEMSIAE